MLFWRSKRPAWTWSARSNTGAESWRPPPSSSARSCRPRDQIDKLRSDIYRIKALNPQHKLESYGIKGVVLAGTIPDTERKRSFELYRNSLSGLSIITFDELLAKLKSLRELLSAKPA
ncbi:DUF4263 domain-containing protein [Mesorhizobium sp. M7A.F.Ca.ET.027.03.2.1]|nr:DUF4263 domain-containing protein [Mesorhizobium sp. M7A.F.Ca.ET.027.03.2.1]TGP87928.1 DUF4263 domain-containing protein [Mesorhizobium sp. M8A.F.Ca.ET.218.01.1.1]TGT15726.1 DUF4263 domain-containing protein [Mesorhizobium sp. M8A.F.Ca.ET.213.01.1.1]